MTSHGSDYIAFLSEHDVDALLLSSLPNIIHATGFLGFSETERDGYTLITKKSRSLFTSPLFETAVRDHSHDRYTIYIYTQTKPFRELLSSCITKENILRLGFEPDSLTVAEWNRLHKLDVQLVPVATHTLRIGKKNQEINDIKKACAVADQALMESIPLIHPGITERSLSLLLEDRIRQRGAEVSFPTIVAFGSHAASPHHVPGSVILKKQDVVLIDFGAKVNGYHSDMTRTFFIGSPTTEQVDAYNAVLTSQQHAVTYCRSQLSSSLTKNRNVLHNPSLLQAANVDKAAREYLLSRSYPSLPHSLGHGIGLAVHEAPHIEPSSQDTLAEGMVFSIEPGIYFPEKFGIRIEDLYTIRNGKLIQLTHFPSHLTVLY